MGDCLLCDHFRWQQWIQTLLYLWRQVPIKIIRQTAFLISKFLILWIEKVTKNAHRKFSRWTFRSDRTFWMTTGLFPQEFIVAFKEPIDFRTIRFATTNGRLKEEKFRSIDNVFLSFSETFRYVFHWSKWPEELFGDLWKKYFVFIVRSLDIRSKTFSLKLFFSDQQRKRRSPENRFHRRPHNQCSLCKMCNSGWLW